MSVLLGKPAAGERILFDQQLTQDDLGVARLVETYRIRAANLTSVLPARGTVHSSFSSAVVKYPRMVVEDSNYSLEPGDLATMQVTYLGLLSSSGFPAARVRLVPGASTDVPYKIEIRFLDLTSAQPGLRYLTGSVAPRVVAGYTLPPELPLSGYSNDWISQRTSSNVLLDGRVPITRSPYLIESYDDTPAGIFSIVRLIIGQTVLESPVVRGPTRNTGRPLASGEGYASGR